MFRPVALTLSFALASALVLTLTFLPTVLSFLVERYDMSERHIAWIDRMREIYRSILEKALGRIRAIFLGSAALLLSLIGWAFGGTRQRPWVALLLVAIVSVVLVVGQTLPPRMERWHAIQYAPNTTPAQKNEAQAAFRRLHGFSQIANLAVMLGVTLYFLQLARPAQRRTIGNP